MQFDLKFDSVRYIHIVTVSKLIKNDYFRKQAIIIPCH